MSESLQELNAGEAYQTAFEQHMEQAESDFFAQARAILMKVEHLVSLDNKVRLDDVAMVAEAIKDISDIAYYDYKVVEQGRYRSYTETYSYDFTEEASDLLADELAYYGELL